MSTTFNDANATPGTATLESLYARDWDVLVRCAFDVLHDADDAEDCVQFVTVKLLRRPPPHDRLNLGYLIIAVRHTAFDMLKRRRMKPRHCPWLPAQNGAFEHSDLDLLVCRDEWHRFVEQLTPRTRTVVEMRAAGRSYEEIALALGISVHTVNRHFERARVTAAQQRERERERERERQRDSKNRVILAISGPSCAFRTQRSVS